MIKRIKNIFRYWKILIDEVLSGRDESEVTEDLLSQFNQDDRDLFLTPDDYPVYGIFRVSNNKWGESKLKSGEYYSQKMYFGQSNMGWSFIPPVHNRGVIGYPSLFIGQSPWGGPSNNSSFPRRIDDIGTLSSHFDVSMSIQDKKYNLTYDIWIGSSDTPSPQSIVHEIMIWEDHNVAIPFGKNLGKVETSFGEYHVYSGYMDRSKENLGVDGWNFTAFVRVDSRRFGTVDIRELMDKMLYKFGFLSRKNYVYSVEFGNEVYNSVGYTIVNDYKLNF